MIDRKCGECGDSSWKKIIEKDYPERRQERDRTVKSIYVCETCGAEGRHFDHQHEGTEIYSGAMR